MPLFSFCREIWTTKGCTDLCGDARNAEETGIRGCRENGRGSVKPVRIDGKETEEHLQGRCASASERTREETDMEKITFTLNGSEKVDFYVLEQTKIGGTDYILVTDMEEGDGDALILKDLSKPEEKDGLYEIVSEEKELQAVAAVFETLMEDVTFVSDDE